MDYYQKKSIYEQLQDHESIINEFAIFDEINILRRDYMEDGSFFDLNYWKEFKIIIFGVLDGHCGDKVMKYVQKNFSQIDDQMMGLKEIESTQNGSCACIGIIQQINNEINILIANIGDTRASQFSTVNDFYQRISYEHKATDEKEKDRIKKSGGIIVYHRVAGQLAVTRAFGDHNLRSNGVIQTPHIEKINFDQKLQYLVIASDGLWDVVDEDQVLDKIKQINNSKELAEKLIGTALKQGTKDNITVMVIQFKEQQNYLNNLKKQELYIETDSQPYFEEKFKDSIEQEQ